MKDKVVIKGEIARILLRKGYRIKDVKPNRDVPLATVFIFEGKEGLEEEINHLIEK